MIIATDVFRTEKYTLTQVWGGTIQGVCLQITPIQGEHFALNKNEVLELAYKLLEWVKDNEG